MGSSIRATVTEWLAMAGVADMNAPNTELTADYRDATRFPPFRSAGVAVEVTIAYDNRRVRGTRGGSNS